MERLTFHASFSFHTFFLLKNVTERVLHVLCQRYVGWSEIFSLHCILFEKYFSMFLAQIEKKEPFLSQTILIFGSLAYIPSLRYFIASVARFNVVVLYEL